jgi:hypothetical protein
MTPWVCRKCLDIRLKQAQIQTEEIELKNTPTLNFNVGACELLHFYTLWEQ